MWRRIQTAANSDTNRTASADGHSNSAFPDAGSAVQRCSDQMRSGRWMDAPVARISTSTPASARGEYARIAAEGGGITGANVSRDGREPADWQYTILWASLETVEHRAYAIASSGLWPAIPDAASLSCTLGPKRIVILVLDNEVIAVHGEDRYTQLFEMIARPKPGHFEFLEFDAPTVDRPVGFGIVDEAGNNIASCCM